jgi:hypothetical protein
VTAFTTIRAVGAALPADVLAATVSDAQLKGLTADDYHLEYGVTPREAANRAWSVLTGAWRGYREALAKLPDNDRAVGITREKWLGVVFRELGYGRPDTTPSGGLAADERKFPISHVHDLSVGQLPLHLLGWGVPLDTKTPGQPGAADRAPHAMVQEYLNRSDDSLWAIISNGRTLRLLRDSSSLIGQSYVEFDIESMFDGEVFSDFVVLYLVCHASRFEPDRRNDATQADCWLERWRTYAAETGTRALKALSPGVKQAIEAFGSGLLRHPSNDLHHRLADGSLTPKDIHEALLRLVYRLLFCFVAEDRGLLLDPNGDVLAKQRYADWFSTSRLRRISTRRRGSAHPDLWHALNIVLDGLGREQGRPELALPGLGGLFDLGPADVVVDCELANEPLLTAIRHLTVVQPAGGGPKRVVDYRNLGAEELGSVYESLLEFVPRYDPNTRNFTLENVAGNDRKTSGAYYTPTSLIDCLLGTALDPLLDEAERSDDPEAALLAQTVCDPACGSGHFLVAAARRIAARLAAVRARTDNGGATEPTIIDEQRAMHDVVDRCIYGVDLNPMAAELAKVSLWLESVQPGRALSFLNGHIKVGNALLGTTPALLAPGLPDAAFTALDGDDKKLVASLRKRNKVEQRGGQGDLFGQAGITVANAELGRAIRRVEALPNTSLADVHLAQQRFREYDTSPALQRARSVADAWCAAFVAVKAPGQPEITHATIQRLADDGEPDAATSATLAELSTRYRFFHWHLEFPQIFTVPDTIAANTDGPGWHGGFSCVLGNPPWDHVELKEQEFFAALDPEVAFAPGAERKRLIESLAERSPTLFAQYRAAKRQADAERAFFTGSGRYPRCGRGRINTYAVFAEHDRSVVAENGRLGVILPTGIATDATTQHFFKDLVVRRALASLYDFENRRPLFEGIDSRIKFCLLTLAGANRRVERAEFAFFLHHPDELGREDACFELTPEELLLLNPNTGTCPVFRSRRDAEIALTIYRRHPILIRDSDDTPAGNPWGLSFMQGLFNMTSDSGLFHTRHLLERDGWTLTGNIFERPGAGDEIERMLPLYQGMMVDPYDHRMADVVYNPALANRPNQPRYLSDLDKDDPLRVVTPLYWVAESEVDERLVGRWDRDWLLGFSDITSATNERTMINGFLPRAGVGNTLPLLVSQRADVAALGAVLSTFVFDYCARLKIGGTHLNFYLVEQLPVPVPGAFGASCSWDGATTYAEWVRVRILELSYSAVDMAPFARDLGDSDSPFRWNVERRAQLRAELDACFFHVYGLDRADTEYVLGTFPIANRKDPGLMKRILTAYDALEEAAVSGMPFVSPLDPPPGFGTRHV